MSDSLALLPRKPLGPRQGPPAPRRFSSTTQAATTTHGYLSSSSCVLEQEALVPIRRRRVTFSEGAVDIRCYVPDHPEEPREEESEESGGLAALVARRKRLLEAHQEEPEGPYITSMGNEGEAAYHALQDADRSSRVFLDHLTEVEEACGDAAHAEGSTD
ncbi:unnamed protein product [Symbiodinium sp. CCMP2456]|nr:unnamed protein product [Symbiodinium sp. CCMP2456]